MTDKNILEFTEEYTNSMLGSLTTGGMCYRVSCPLSTLMNLMGVENELMEGEVFYFGRNIQHFWLQLSDGRILDPTADQFNDEGIYNLPQTYLGDKPDWYKIKKV